MLFVLYTVLAFVFQSNCFNIKRENNDLISDVNVAVQKNTTTTANYNFYLNMIENSRKAPNLKSNIFDKMLSNEMFSIKQHLYDKDVISQVHMSFKNNVATPTLEINQKWPIEKVMPKGNVESYIENATSDDIINNSLSNINNVATEINENGFKDNDLNMQLGIKNKVIEVRSFSVMPNHNSETLSHIQQAKRQCTCMKNNPHTSCSHRDSVLKNTEKICTHTENDLITFPECTRTPEDYSVSLTYFPYYAYPSYFLGITTDPFPSYYHPDVVNDLKLPKKNKHRKLKKPYIDDELFLESEESEEVDDNENQYDYLESTKPESKINKCPKNKCKKSTKINSVNYDSNGVETFDSFKKIYNGYVKVIDKDNFVDDIIEDLKVYYNEAVIKDCYCSTSCLRYKSKGILICLITSLKFVM